MSTRTHRLRDHLPFLAWPRPTAQLLRQEALASLTVAVVMVPQSVAYATLAGMPLVTGLYATFLPALLAVLFSRSTRLSVGPSALTSLLVGASLAGTGLATAGSASWVQLAVWLALLAGGLQLALGLGGGAWVLNAVSAPVLTGFSQAAALLIIASQLPALLGLSNWPAGALLQAQGGLPPIDWEAVAYGLGAWALLAAAARWAARWPTALVVLAGSAAISAATGYSHRGAVVGALPSGLPALYLPGWPGWDALSALLVPALVIALVSSLELAASAKIESQREGRPWDAAQDLVGQGVGKLAAAFSGAFPTSTSFSRSALTLYAGARSGWATVLASGWVVGVLLFFTPALQHVPRAVLAAVVVAAVAGLVKPRVLLRLWRINRVEALIATATLLLTLATAPRIYWGVLAGVLMGLAHFLYHHLHPRIIDVGLHPDGSLRDRHLWQLPPLAAGVLALRMDAELDFASANALERAVMERLEPQGRGGVGSATPPATVSTAPVPRAPTCEHFTQLCLFAQPINRIDATGVEVFERLRQTLAQRAITLHVSGLKLPVEQALQRAGALTAGPLLQLHRTDGDTLEALATLAHH